MTPRNFCGFFIAVTSMLMGASTMASSLDVNLSNDVAQFRYLQPFSSGTGAFGSSELEFGFLYTTNDDLMGVLGFQVVDEAGSGSPGLNVGLGIKGFSLATDNHDILAATLGGQVRYAPPMLNRFAIGAEVFFAPDIVSFVDAERFLYTGARVEYEVLPQATVYLGYRKIKANIKNAPDETIDNGGHVGIKFLF